MQVETELSRVHDEKFEQLCYACRVGDLENVDRLIAAGVTLNGVDAFDNSPLFLASLCGHEEIVKLLLKRGSVCDRDRHEGARCIYGALTDSIRNILLDYDISKAVDLSQPFAMHISSLIRKETATYQDIKMNLGDSVEALYLHKFILASRSRYFNGKFLSSWKEKEELDLYETTFIAELKLLIKFMYLVPILHMITPSQIKNMIALSKKFYFVELREFLQKLQFTNEPKAKSALMAEYQYKFTENSREDLSQFVKSNILANRVTVGCVDEMPLNDLYDFSAAGPFCDCFVRYQDKEKKIYYLYPAHKAILIRSDYLKTMFCSTFLESGKKFPILEFPGSKAAVVEMILKYLYYDDIEVPVDDAVDILLAADALLLDRLKTIAAIAITTNETRFLEKYSIFQILDVAWETQVERLEHFVAKVLAYNLDRYANDESLHRAIRQSATRIEERQATDTIELVDDINYYLLEKHHLLYTDENGDYDYDILSEEGAEVSMYLKDKDIINKILLKLGLSAFVPESQMVSAD
ncbi:hypothetical protein ACO0QE_000184 [Hanseniaspora vineae]